MKARAFLCLLVLTSCQKPITTTDDEPLAENVLAQVGADVITVEDFQQAMQRRPVGTDATARRALLDELIQTRALVQEAKARGYDRDPQMLASFERMLANKVRAEDETARAAQAEVTDAAIATHYQAHEKTFAIPAKIRAAMIFVEAPAAFTKEKRAERRASLEAAREKAVADPAQFAALSAEVSFDQATKHRGGDLGYLVEGQTPADDPDAPIHAAAFALREPGDLSEILTTPAGFHFLRLTERQPAATRPLDTVRDQIRSELQREKQSKSAQAFAATILAGRKVAVRPERLAAIPAPLAKTSSEVPEPPAAPVP